MTTFRRSSAIVLLVLSLGVATTAWAGTAQYSGSLIIQAFGNDTSTGTISPYDNYLVLGHPFGITCNPNYGPGTKVCGDDTPYAQAGSPLTGSGTVTVTTGNYPAKFALPQSAMSRVLGTPATVVYSYPKKGVTRPIRCERWIRQHSTVTPTPTPPPAGCGVPGGSFSAFYPYIYSYSYASLKNAAGNFFGGGGPGNLSWSYTIKAVPVAKMIVKQGANRFGGTMKLLGHFYSQGAYYSRGGLSAGSWEWLFNRVGGQGYYSGTTLTSPGSATATYTLWHTKLEQKVTATVKARYVGWTTGTVTVTASRGPFPTVMQRKGYDNRTSKGLGNIQMVSPLITHWFGYTETETAGVGIMKLVFAPEPSRWMMLFAGASLLGILYRTQRRSR